VAFEHDGSGEEGPGFEDNNATALGRAGVDGALDGVRIFGDAVTLRAVGCYVADARGVGVRAGGGQRGEKEYAEGSARRNLRRDEIGGLRHQGLHFLKAGITQGALCAYEGCLYYGGAGRAI